MIDDDLKQLAEQPPDHALDALEADIWQGVTVREQSLRTTRRLVVLQAIVLAVAVVFSFLAGQQWRSAHQARTLDAFSPQMPLSASTLLAGNRP
jgi:hypothetical protein